MIKELLNETTIEVNFKATSWESAVRESGELLKKAGKVNSLYIDEMVKGVKELGPYIVISKNIAMPHARPEEGSNGIGVSLITLKTPINFGNKENDPIRIIISIVAIDQETHIKMMEQLMNMMERKDFYSSIINSNSKEEVINFIKQC